MAIKFIPRRKLQTRREIENLHREVNISMALKHPNIVSVSAVIDSDPKYIGVVMEYVGGGELFHLLEQMSVFSEIEAFLLFHQLCAAFAYLHERGIAHRDLKLENILLDDNHNIKLIDFGLSKYGSNALKMRTLCGTKYYLSPEIVRGEPYDKSCDIWALGVVLFVMCCGFMPFDHDDEVRLMKAISVGRVKMPDYISDDLRELLARMLDMQKATRISIGDIQKSRWVARMLAELKNTDAPPPKLPLRFKVEAALLANRKFQIEVCDQSPKIVLSSCVKARYNIVGETVFSRVNTPGTSFDGTDGPGDGAREQRLRPGPSLPSRRMEVARPDAAILPRESSPEPMGCVVGDNILRRASKMEAMLRTLNISKSGQQLQQQSGGASQRVMLPPIEVPSRRRFKNIASRKRSSRHPDATEVSYSSRYPRRSQSPGPVSDSPRRSRKRQDQAQDVKMKRRRSSAGDSKPWTPSHSPSERMRDIVPTVVDPAQSSKNVGRNLSRRLDMVNTSTNPQAARAKKAVKVGFKDSGLVQPISGLLHTPQSGPFAMGKKSSGRMPVTEQKRPSSRGASPRRGGITRHAAMSLSNPRGRLGLDAKETRSNSFHLERTS